MTVDIQHIPYDTFGKNALVIIRVPDMKMVNTSGLDGLTSDLRAKVDPSVNVLFMHEDMKVELLTEELMNRGGWYRKTS
jgi:hypothetical protein